MNIESEEECLRGFTGVFIPREVYLDDRLNWNERILLCEIDALDANGSCFASNAYFAKFLGIAEANVSRAISRLKELGYVEQVSFDGRKRVLKSNMQTCRKRQVSLDENVKSNLTETSRRINKDKEIEYKDSLFPLVVLPKKNQNGCRFENSDLCKDEIPDIFLEEAKRECPMLDAKREYLVFKDYWIARTGQIAVKKDWTATWRNWIRRGNQTNGNYAKKKSLTEQAIESMEW